MDTLTWETLRTTSPLTARPWTKDLAVTKARMTFAFMSRGTSPKGRSVSCCLATHSRYSSDRLACRAQRVVLLHQGLPHRKTLTLNTFVHLFHTHMLFRCTTYHFLFLTESLCVLLQKKKNSAFLDATTNVGHPNATRALFQPAVQKRRAPSSWVKVIPRGCKGRGFTSYRRSKPFKFANVPKNSKGSNVSSE